MRIIKLNHKDVAKDIANACLTQCGVNIRVEMDTLVELKNALVISIDPADEERDFSYEEILNFIKKGWLSQESLKRYIKEEFDEEESESKENKYYYFGDLKYIEEDIKNTAYENVLIEKTYGKNSKLIGTEGYYDNLTIIIGATEY